LKGLKIALMICAVVLDVTALNGLCLLVLILLTREIHLHTTSIMWLFLVEKVINMRKVYVAVNADFSPEGKVTPHWFMREDGCKFAIDRLLDVGQTALTRAGGIGSPVDTPNFLAILLS
jgi:hypothetical protein